MGDEIRIKCGITDTFKPKKLINGIKLIFNRNATPKLKNLANFFKDNKNTAALNVLNFDTSNVEIWNRTFEYNTIVTDITNYDLSSATNIYHMCRGCTALVNISEDLLSDLSNVVGDASMIFADCTKLIKVGDISLP